MEVPCAVRCNEPADVPLLSCFSSELHSVSCDIDMLALAMLLLRIALLGCRCPHSPA